MSHCADAPSVGTIGGVEHLGICDNTIGGSPFA